MAKMMMMNSAMKASMKMKKSMKAMVMKKGEWLLIKMIVKFCTAALIQRNLMFTQNFYSFIDLFLASAMKKRAMKKTAKSYKTTAGARAAVFSGKIMKS